MTQIKFSNWRLIAAVVICLAGFQGCSNSSPEVADSKKSTETAAPSNETTTVAAVKSSDAASPATAASATPPVDAKPEEVCIRFMNLLQSGNRIAAENLLTRTALITTTKEGLKLQPMGGPTAIYKFTDVRFATSKQKLAQVTYTITDKVGTETFEMPITWLARKQSKGWRISGVILELDEGAGPDLLSFENVADVGKIKMAAGEEIAGAAETRQADATNQTTTSNPSLK
ncbi:MAG: hypothetical protein AB8B55_24210 [Mariniblastus sp.]